MPAASDESIRLEVTKGLMRMSVAWPVSAAGCAAVRGCYEIFCGDSRGYGLVGAGPDGYENGLDSAMARVIAVFGAAQRLYKGQFVWASPNSGTTGIAELSRTQQSVNRSESPPSL